MPVTNDVTWVEDGEQRDYANYWYGFVNSNDEVEWEPNQDPPPPPPPVPKPGVPPPVPPPPPPPPVKKPKKPVPPVDPWS